MFEIGAISKTEMRKFDEMCLAQDPETEHAVEKTAPMEHAIA
jgi:hypothetical protein